MMIKNRRIWTGSTRARAPAVTTTSATPLPTSKGKKCSPGFLNKKACVKVCPDKLLADTKAANCVPCPAQATCKQGLVTTCQSGWLINPSKTACIACPTHAVCRNGVVSSCDTGLLINAQQTACGACPRRTICTGGKITSCQLKQASYLTLPKPVSPAPLTASAPTVLSRRAGQFLLRGLCLKWCQDGLQRRPGRHNQIYDFVNHIVSHSHFDRVFDNVVDHLTRGDDSLYHAEHHFGLFNDQELVYALDYFLNDQLVAFALDHDIISLKGAPTKATKICRNILVTSSSISEADGSTFLGRAYQAPSTAPVAGTASIPLQYPDHTSSLTTGGFMFLSKALAGTPPQEFTILWDTGSPLFWVDGTTCVDGTCNVTPFRDTVTVGGGRLPFSFKLSLREFSLTHALAFGGHVQTQSPGWTRGATNGLFGMSFNGPNSGHKYEATVNADAIVDSGTVYVVMVDAVAAAAFASIPDWGYYQNSTASKMYTYPCATPPVFTFSFPGGSTAWTISEDTLNLGQVDDTNCLASVMGGADAAAGGAGHILGDAFMQNVYTTFDSDNARVGFSQLS
ncbi:BQ5605_C039g11821 [Microbotryum silenes-dioicae]|uniref:BQ5605_C039g11821 protein n=1 Tax=Microbotryum silenes-dioicae TaxID=796604 RepID=A0A2X0MEF5_9BASI|nr:BQ5605_C039g11821 [Microbotryum silenes-dioicae]